MQSAEMKYAALPLPVRRQAVVGSVAPRKRRDVGSQMRDRRSDRFARRWAITGYHKVDACNHRGAIHHVQPTSGTRHGDFRCRHSLPAYSHDTCKRTQAWCAWVPSLRGAGSIVRCDSSDLTMELVLRDWGFHYGLGNLTFSAPVFVQRAR
jgi:hypothetical protein